jgi:geranylgeranyl pyrophosphate synthase
MSKDKAWSEAPTADAPSPAGDLLELLEQEFREQPTGDGGAGPRLPRALWDRALLGPVREFLRRPGKGMRARLVDTGWRLGGGASGAAPRRLALLVELLHAGSLVLDDIQDHSSERRGAPALHRLCGVPLALNTGSWMIFWPLQILGQIEFPAGAGTEAYRRVAAALVSCHQGQALDLALPVGELEPGEIGDVVAMSTRLRTASLTELATWLGGLAAGASPRALEALAGLGRELGLGLQMLDDLGGLTTSGRRHKGDEDLRLGRPTWVWAWAAESAGASALAQLQSQSREVTAGRAELAPLRDALASRAATIGRRRVRAVLDAAMSRASQDFPRSPALDALAADIAHLERRYG